jgi:hypothetical protein
VREQDWHTLAINHGYKRVRRRRPSAGTTSTQSSGSPKFERSEQRQRIERPHRQSLRVLCVTAKAGPPTVKMGSNPDVTATTELTAHAGIAQKADVNSITCARQGKLLHPGRQIHNPALERAVISA